MNVLVGPMRRHGVAAAVPAEHRPPRASGPPCLARGLPRRARRERTRGRQADAVAPPAVRRHPGVARADSGTGAAVHAPRRRRVHRTRRCSATPGARLRRPPLGRRVVDAPAPPPGHSSVRRATARDRHVPRRRGRTRPCAGGIDRSARPRCRRRRSPSGTARPRRGRTGARARGRDKLPRPNWSTW